MAILRSLGLRQADLLRLYLWQGFFIALAGLLCGLCLGYALLYYLHHYPLPFLSASYTGGEVFPVKVSLSDSVLLCLGSLFLATLASVWPALEVRRLDVVDVLSMRN